MSTQTQSPSDTSPESLHELIMGTKPLQETDFQLRDMDRDPEYTAISLRSDVVREIYDGMEELQIKPAALARKWGRSRQYLSDILNEDKSRNFTIDTIVEIMHLLGRRVEIRFPKYEEEGENSYVLKCVKHIKANVQPPEFLGVDASLEATIAKFSKSIPYEGWFSNDPLNVIPKWAISAEHDWTRADFLPAEPLKSYVRFY